LLVRLWASRHQTDEGPILAMAITDISEQSRDAAVSGLENLVAGSRVVLGALSHEIKNLAAAIGAETRQLERAGAPTDHLLGLAQGLEKLASAQLQGLRPRSDIRTDARRVLQEIGAMLSAEFLSERAALHIQAMENPLWVRADYHGLQQVLLNLLTNALRECGRSETDNECRVEILVEPNLTRVRILSPGAPLATEHLFRAFAPDAKGTGLGLYISRSILRSFGGDLRYDETSDRPCFVVELVTAPAPPGPEEAEA